MTDETTQVVDNPRKSETGPIAAKDAHDPTRCKAKSHGTGLQCGNKPMPGRTVCRYHGGLTPRGAASPGFKHGRYSKSLTGPLLARYQEAAADPELLSVRDEIALVDTRIAAVLEKLPTGEPGALWGAIQQQMEAFRDAEKSRDVSAMGVAIRDMEANIKAGQEEHRSWSEIIGLVSQRARLSEVESRRMVDAHAMLRLDELSVFLGELIDAIRTNVTDRRALSRIINVIERAQLIAPGS